MRIIFILIGLWGVLSLIYGLKTGRSLRVGRQFTGMVERDKEPLSFWLNIIIYVAISCVGIYYSIGYNS